MRRESIGKPIRRSDNPDEERMITWRLRGDMFNRLSDITDKLGISNNRFITQAMKEAILELEEKFEEEKHKYLKPYIDRRFKNKIRK